MLEHGEHLLELSRHFGVNRVQSSKDHIRRYECADLKSCLDVVVVVSTVRLRNLSEPRTCHRARTLPIFAFDATNFSRRSPDFHSSLRPGSFFLPRFGLIEFSHPSRSPRILRHRQTRQRMGARPRVLCELLQIGVESMLVQ